MTERERLGTRGLFYRLTGDYRQGVREYGEVVKRYNGDVMGLNQLALCRIHLREFAQAAEDMRKVVALVPNRALFRVNLSLYSSYAGDFQAGVQEARVAIDLGLTDWGHYALARAEVGRVSLCDATEAYHELARVNPRMAAKAALGLGALAVYAGRFSEAAAILENAWAERDEHGPSGSILSLLAQTRLVQGEQQLASLCATQALENAGDDRFVRWRLGRFSRPSADSTKRRPSSTNLTLIRETRQQRMRG